MEGEINNFIMVWATVLCCLYYCHTIDALFPRPNFTRFFAIFPIACLFLVLPLNLTSINLGGTTSFFIGWLGSFKLILFALGKGPLSSSPPLPLTTFIPLACFPINFQQHEKLSDDKSFTVYEKSKSKFQQYNKFSEQPIKKSHYRSTSHVTKIVLNHQLTGHVTKLVLIVLTICMYNYKQNLHPKFILFLYTLHIYFSLELMLVTVSALIRTVSRVELEQPFHEPYLSTSLQDFWGKRWNIMVTTILRPTVYMPVRSVSVRLMPARLAASTAVMATFVASGIMHELVFYNIGRAKPSGEVLSFFVVNGACLVLEIGIKKTIEGKFYLPRIVSGPLALAFVILTSFWLFFPPLLRNNADVKGCTESLAFIEFVKYHRLVSPDEMICPFL